MRKISEMDYFALKYPLFTEGPSCIYIYIYTAWNDKIVVLKKTTLQLYFKTYIEKINSGNLIM